jgi:osmotically-inducible protein OsmY
MEIRPAHWTKFLATMAVLLAAVGAGGCGSSGYARRTAQDGRLSALVQHRLAATPILSGSKVEAKSYSGVVALLGEVPDEEVKREAGQLAGGVPGVVRVNSLIVVVKGDLQAEGSPLPADSLFIARTE